MSLKSLIRTNWIGLLGLLIGTIGATLSFYFYKTSTEPPEPTFLLDPSRTIIVDSKRFFEAPLRVVRPNNNEIKGDVTSVRFYFWNNGRKSIRPLQILRPIIITLDDTDGEILDYKILKSSREVVEPVIKRYSIDPGRNLVLSFSILEQGDGVTCQVVYEGKPNADFSISGEIEEVDEIITNRNLVSRRFWSEYGKKVGFFVLVVGGYIIFMLIIHFASNWIASKYTFRKILGYCAMTLLVIVIIGYIAFMIWALAVNPVKEARKEASATVIQTIPKEIIP